MCRIYGYFGTKEISSKILEKVGSLQINGGPDAQHLKTGEGWALGNNRLAIQGLDGGIQPFYSNRINAVYNGEIYNYKELKKILSEKGYKFYDNCDGSVIIPLYELYGEDFVKYLDGMFAIAIVDEREQKKLILASDSAAIKSAYYYWEESSDTLYFSSELPSLLSFQIEKTLRLEAADEYLVGRSIWHNRTFFQNIFTLPPASFLIKKNERAPELFHYETHVNSGYEGGVTFEEAAFYFDELFKNEIKQMVQADVPACVVTSGGLDSSYVTALSSQYINDLHCFNVAYEGEWPSDERRFAKEVSSYYNATYHQVTIKENDFPQILKETIHHLGQPNSAPHSLSTHALFKEISQAGFKVAITGEGADEYFGGYDRFKSATFNMESKWLEQYFDLICATTQELRNLSYTSEYTNFLLSNKHNPLKNAKDKILNNEKKLKSRLKSLLQFDQTERFTSYILRRVDHLSMANAVEVRVPFCQPKISSFSKLLPDDFLLNENSVKRIIYQAAYDKIPLSILSRPKQPFTLPITSMLKKGFILFDILYDTLSTHSFLSRGLFNHNEIQKLIKRHLDEPSHEIANLLWSIMILELWLQHINSELIL